MKLLERASQLSQLNAALDQAGSGQGCIVLLHGEAGIGKTSLVEHFVNENKGSWRILEGACDSLFTPRPLGPLHDIASQTQGNLLALLDAESSRQAIFSACLSELKTQKTILVVEDVHWADEATLDLLKYVGRRIRQTASLMVLTYRDDELGLDHPLRLLLGDLASSHVLQRIPVTPLTKEAVHVLAENKDVDAAALYRLTNGNPFFVTEVLAVESGVPETVRDAVLARAARLSPSARNVLEAAAVIGTRAEAWVLSKLARAEFAGVEECVAKGVLRAQGEYYAFRHELARQTILESISTQRKIAFHRLTLNALKDSPETRSDLARLANHASGAKDASAVLEYTPAAASRASRLGAHRQASAHYQIVLQHASHLPAEEHAELLDRYSDECHFVDQMAEAKRAQEEALRLWRELGRREKEGRALRRLSEICLETIHQTHALESERYITESIDILSTLPPSIELAMAYSHKSRFHMIAHQADETIYWGSLAIELAERLGDAGTLAHALNNIGSMQAWTGQHAEGLEKMQRSLQISLAAGLDVHVARAFFNLANCLIEPHDYEASLQYVNKGIAYCAQNDLDYWSHNLLITRAEAHFEQGRWAESEKDVQTALALSSESELEILIDILLSRMHARRGRPILPDTLRGIREFAQQSIFTEAKCKAALLFAEIAWLKRDLKRCRAEAEPIFQMMLQRKTPFYMSRLAYWMWRAGAINQPPNNTIEPYSIQINGNWRAAALMWEKFGCPYDQATALMDGDEAAQLEALEIFERLGARPIIAILKQQMRTQGIDIPRGPRPATRENRFGLTVREMEVLSCLVKGQSNRIIANGLSLSTRTVEHHITSILQKMGVASRAEAVALAAEGGWTPSD